MFTGIVEEVGAITQISERGMSVMSSNGACSKNQNFFFVFHKSYFLDTTKYQSKMSGPETKRFFPSIVVVYVPIENLLFVTISFVTGSFFR